MFNWYRHNSRDLPWRDTTNPYRIWLSEIILQQTRIEQGLSYYNKFVETYPEIHSLAKAPLDEVLRLWQGLGYYSRARNLHKCAKIISEERKGRFPDNYDELIKLPGVGPYTAAAIASFAFGQPVPAVDGNVIRFASRYFGITDDMTRQVNVRKLGEILSEVIPDQDPGTFNQAMMEYGSRVCKPTSPLCSSCGFSQECFARINGVQKKLPDRKKKVKMRTRHFHYFPLIFGNRILMKKRSNGDIWSGLYDFYLIEGPETIDDNYLPDLFKINGISIPDDPMVFRHVLSHQLLIAHFYPVILREDSDLEQLQKGLQNSRFFTHLEIDNLPKPILIDRYLKDHIF